MKQIKVLQIKHDNTKETHYRRFSSLRMLKEMGMAFNASYYEVVFDGQTDVKDAEDVYTLCNIGQKPNGYKGHSLSVSDIVLIDGKYMFCDSFGFKDVTDMWANQ